MFSGVSNMVASFFAEAGSKYFLLELLIFLLQALPAWISAGREHQKIDGRRRGHSNPSARRKKLKDERLGHADRKEESYEQRFGHSNIWLDALCRLLYIDDGGLTELGRLKPFRVCSLASRITAVTLLLYSISQIIFSGVSELITLLNHFPSVTFHLSFPPSAATLSKINNISLLLSALIFAYATACTTILLQRLAKLSAENRQMSRELQGINYEARRDRLLGGMSGILEDIRFMGAEDRQSNRRGGYVLEE